MTLHLWGVALTGFVWRRDYLAGPVYLKYKLQYIFTLTYSIQIFFFTSESKITWTIAFLDILYYDFSCTSVYRKPTFTGIFINFDRFIKEVSFTLFRIVVLKFALLIDFFAKKYYNSKTFLHFKIMIVRQFLQIQNKTVSEKCHSELVIQVKKYGQEAT